MNSEIMQDIILPIDREVIKSELTKDRFLRHTNNLNNEIYLVNHENAPNTLKEIGRLREVTFRASGGGTGLACDLDENDQGEFAYDQLIVWSPEDEEIIAGYRLIRCDKVLPIRNNEIHLSTAHYFNFSEKFIEEYLPQTIELGRSFVQPKYQPSGENRKGLFSLDNLWDGLGAVVQLNPDIKYLFGKVTMYSHFNLEARDFILTFMHHYFPDKEKLVWPKHPVPLKTCTQEFLNQLQGLSYKDGYKVLNTKVRSLGENIPPLINTYMNLSLTMKSFGTAINGEFGEVEETGILISIPDIYEAKKDRHMNTFERDKEHGSRVK